MKLNLFGDRVAIVKVEEEFDGKIIIPDNTHQQHWIGRIVSTSPKVHEEGEFKNGQLVMFQTNAMMEFNNSVRVGDSDVMVLHPNDIISILDGMVVKLENFKIASQWVLLKGEDVGQVSSIILPDQGKQQNSHYIRWFVEQKGAKTAKNLFKVGDEVAVQKGRCNPISINHDTYFYVTQDNLHGVISEDDAAE